MGSGERVPVKLEVDFAPAIDFLNRYERFVVASHRGPDGDAIGSLLAMSGVIEAFGKSAWRYACDTVPYPLSFLVGATRVSASLPEDGDWAVVLLDCSDPERSGVRLQKFAATRPLLVIDHHLVAGSPTGAVVCDPTAASVGMLVEQLSDKLGVSLTVAIAEAVYTTIVSDTGSFHYSNTTPVALRSAARMVELGVDPWRVASFLYEAEPLNRIQLLGEVLSTLDVSEDGVCATLLVSRDMLHRHKAGDDLLDGFINYGRRVQGVEIAVLIREIRGGLYKCSMRSRGRVNVAAVAARFGGGGHHNAAGCQLPGDYAVVRKTILEAVREELSRCITVS